MFAEAAAAATAAAPQVVTAWNQVVVNGAVTLGIIGGGTTVVRWLVKRWVNGIDANLMEIKLDLSKLDAAKLDKMSCDERMATTQATMDGITKRLDDVYALVVNIDRHVSGDKK